MLPMDPSPCKQKVVNIQRVCEWVSQSNTGLLPKVDELKVFKKGTKRKVFQNENASPSCSLSAKRIKSSSKPMSPRKFYLPNGESELHSNKVR